jgi:DNA repair protein RecO (recombination protein O)
MPVYSDEAVVLRTARLGEADRIVTLLTLAHGKIRAVAKGVRKPRSRFGARLEPFMRCRLQLFQGRSALQIVTQAVEISAYARPIAQDYGLFVAASLMCETADKLIADDSGAQPAHYRLLAGALAALASRRLAPWQAAQSYELRALAQEGWRPRLATCVVCGKGEPERDLAFFSVPLGGMVCSIDRAGVGAQCRPLSHEGAVALRSLLMGDWAHCPVRENHQVTAIVEEWTQYYLERPLHSAGLLG